VVTEAIPLDAATVVVVVAVVGGVVVAVVAVVALVPVVPVGLDELLTVVDDVDVDVETVDVVAAAVRCAVVFAAVVVVPPACAARPAKSPVPVTAPTRDHRVNRFTRRRPASRSLRLRRVALRLFMH
jgi:hypothetical protein